MARTIRSEGREALRHALAAARKAAGLMQAQLTAHLRCHRSFVTRIRPGQRRVDAWSWSCSRAIGLPAAALLAAGEAATSEGIGSGDQLGLDALTSTRSQPFERKPQDPDQSNSIDDWRTSSMRPSLLPMFLGYRDGKTERFASSAFVKAFSGLEAQATKRLAILNAAPSVDALRALPCNRREGLKRDRAGQWSIRVNDQWRLRLERPDEQAGPSAVEIVDYHEAEEGHPWLCEPSIPEPFSGTSSTS